MSSPYRMTDLWYRKPRFIIESAAFHRNGSAGEGFYVGVVRDRKEQRRFLITFFPEYGRNALDDEVLKQRQTRIAVVDLAMATEANIYMHPTYEHPGGNAWDGAMFENLARELIAECNRRWAAEHPDLVF